MAELAMVLLHGYPFAPNMWDPVTGRAKIQAKVLTPLLYPPAGPATDEPSLDTAANAIAALLDQQGCDRAVVCGFSMGGYVALAFAHRHGARLAGLGLINSQGVADTEQVRAGRREMIQRLEKEGPGAASAAAIPKLFTKEEPGLVAYVERGLHQAGKAGLQWALEAMARRPDRTDVFLQAQVPRLVVHSDQDKFIPVERARELAAKTTGASYVEVKGVGHASPLEAPDVVAKAIADLWARCR